MDYYPSPVPTRVADLPRYLEEEFQKLSHTLKEQGYVRWQGAYVAGNCYFQDDMVTDAGVLYIANTGTCAAPAGSTEWDIAS